MRNVMAFAIAAVLTTASVSGAAETKKPEFIAEHMAVKLVRGVTNVATSVVELPKQTYKSVVEKGPIGYVTGPPKGVLMTFYRFFIGATETIFFMVPQPGYYDEMIDPEYVWNGWKTSPDENAGKDQQ